MKLTEIEQLRQEVQALRERLEQIDEDAMLVEMQRLRAARSPDRIDTQRPGGGVDRKWIPAHELDKPTDLDARLRRVGESLRQGRPIPWSSI